MYYSWIIKYRLYLKVVTLILVLPDFINDNGKRLRAKGDWQGSYLILVLCQCSQLINFLILESHALKYWSNLSGMPNKLHFLHVELLTHHLLFLTKCIPWAPILLLSRQTSLVTLNHNIPGIYILIYKAPLAERLLWPDRTCPCLSFLSSTSMFTASIVLT